MALREHERLLAVQSLADPADQAVQPVVPLALMGILTSVKSSRIFIGRYNRQQRFFFHGIDLVDDQNRRNLCFLDFLNQLLLLRADVCDRLNEQNNGIDVGNRLIDDVHHIIAQLRARSMEARRVDKHQLCIAAVNNGRRDAVDRSSRLWSWGLWETIAAADPFRRRVHICKRGLANVAS